MISSIPSIKNRVYVILKLKAYQEKFNRLKSSHLDVLKHLQLDEWRYNSRFQYIFKNKIIF